MGDGIRKRRSVAFFNDDVPDKSIIDDIILDSVTYTPNKCTIPYHKVKVYGPEYKEDKEKLVIQTNCDPKYKEIADSPYFVDFMRKEYEEWLKMHMDDRPKHVIRKRFNYYNFNPQVLAPYLFIFYNINEKKVDNRQPHIIMEESDSQIKATQSSSMHAYNIACLAAEKNISSSFCQDISCHTKYNDHRIDVNYDIVMCLGLGYPLEIKWNPKYRDIPKVEKVVEWQ